MAGPLVAAAALAPIITIGPVTADAVPLIISPVLPRTLLRFLRFTSSSGVGVGSGVAFASQYESIEFPFAMFASARAASAAATFGALTPAFFAWSMAASSLAGSAWENIPGIAALSCFSAVLTSPGAATPSSFGFSKTC